MANAALIRYAFGSDPGKCPTRHPLGQSGEVELPAQFAYVHKLFFVLIKVTLTILFYH